jgi:hypothetical protein
MSRLAGMWCAALVIGLAVSGCGSTPDAAPLKELQKVRSGDVDVVLLSETGTLAQGKNSFVLEFGSADGRLRDVGAVRATATMPMAGMAPMFGTLDLRPSGTPGRYLVNGEFGMTGTWQIKVEWQGGSATLSGAVR